ncbi:hypothetical protein AFL94_08880 [Arthrobacter sp. LS16]|nr:hypothetical protein AFL94_08880 [Arthrobacter sp. LS16]
MSHLPGNPHVKGSSAALSRANNWSLTAAEYVSVANTEATLALAYEQRTANLIALWGHPDSSSIPGLDYEAVREQIKDRLERRAEK